jgi:hypothetical protein
VREPRSTTINLLLGGQTVVFDSATFDNLTARIFTDASLETEVVQGDVLVDGPIFVGIEYPFENPDEEGDPPEPFTDYYDLERPVTNGRFVLTADVTTGVSAEFATSTVIGSPQSLSVGASPAQVQVALVAAEGDIAAL